MESSQHSSSFDGEALGKQIIGMVREHQQKLIRTLEALEYALVNYSGEYEVGKCYSSGVVVKHGGSLWRAAYKTATEPGSGQAWTQWLLSQKETAS